MVKDYLPNAEVEDFCLNTRSNFAFVLLRTKAFGRQVVGFDILKDEQQKYLFDFKVASQGRNPVLKVNWRGEEVLLIVNGHVYGYKMPLEQLSLMYFAKSIVLSHMKNEDISKLDLPKGMKQYILT